METRAENPPFLQIRNPRDAPLRIPDHLDEQERKRRPAQLRILAPAQVAVVDGLAVRRVPQPGRLARRPLLHCLLRLLLLLLLLGGERRGGGGGDEAGAWFEGAHYAVRRWEVGGGMKNARCGLGRQRCCGGFDIRAVRGLETSRRSCGHRLPPLWAITLRNTSRITT